MHDCCDNFKYSIEKGTELEYDSKLRSYSMILNSSDNNCTHQDIWYCPWCGAKLPKDLDGVWSKVLREEYGIKDPIHDDSNKVPPEFETDEWWKKRGL